MTTTTTTKDHDMRNRTIIATVTAALLLLPGLLSACASTPDSSTAGGGATGAATRQDALNQMSTCLRDKGYDLPDSGSAEGSMLAVPDGADPTQYAADTAACSEEAGLSDGTPAESVADSPDGREAAECIREHGFEDYPDDEAGRSTYRGNDDPAFAPVERECWAQVSGAGE